MTGRTTRWIIAATFCLLPACAGETAPAASDPVEATGSCGDANQAQVCTWATAQGDQLVEFGAMIPVASIENAPMEVEMAWPPPAVVSLDLPDVAQAGGFEHMTMNWEPMGHGPTTYMTPHFDFHFYMIPQADRVAIDCSNESKPATLAPDYSLPDEELPPEVAAMIGVSTLVGVCVPEMGMHSVPTASLTATDTFDGTIVVGYYDTEVIFIEPMIAQSKLLERQSFDIAIPAVPGLEGRQPTLFRALYSADLDAYRFTFSGMSM